MAKPSVLFFLLLLITPILLSLLVHNLRSSNGPKLHLVNASRIGEGRLPGPEDLAYDEETKWLYTGCSDGWIRRVRVGVGENTTVEDWAFVDGRPLGVALGPNGQLYVANADKGLMVVEPNGNVKLLVDEVEGVKFGLTDGVNVAKDGTVYFTDATYKYSLEKFVLDVVEGKPNGRLMSYDPTTNVTKVLVRDLYFANGVSLSPSQDDVIYCESTRKRCRRYHIHGENKGTISSFMENMHGFPDNIRYDGNSSYWIAMFSEETCSYCDWASKYPIIRSIIVFIEKLLGTPILVGSGALEVSLEGKPLSLYVDPSFHVVTGAIKIGKHLYVGHLKGTHISLVDLDQYMK